MSRFALFALVCLQLGYVLAHPFYRDRIPNGYTVPNPCGTGYWEPVGHYDPIHHTHDKNPFGRAFAANGHLWTAALCNADSDGDGVTNGAELGDPTCVWTPGTVPTGAATGHPGICSSIGSCSVDNFSCGCHGHSCVGK